MKITPRANNMTQDNAIKFWNERNLPMASLAFIWQLQKDNSDEEIKELRKDWKGINWQVTSTRILYDVSSLKGKVIHDFGSTITEQTEIELDEIPICQPTYLNELLESESGLEYVRALINDMKATKEKIIEGFEKLSGKKSKKIRFWTPTEEERLNRVSRAVGLYFCDGRFFVSGDGWVVSDGGFSRGVIIDSASKKQCKSNKDKFKEGYNQAIDNMIAKLKSMKK